MFPLIFLDVIFYIRNYVINILKIMEKNKRSHTYYGGAIALLS
ncbi:MAG: hypothetical protein PUP91_23095 [Rhizonema sp. PD37]|nr:hypothetical protein [Rhizonema sp. PD37]